MINSELFDCYLSSIKRLGNTQGASVCISSDGASMLCPDQSGEPLPELASTEVASRSALSMMAEKKFLSVDGQECMIRVGQNPLSLLVLVPYQSSSDVVSPVLHERRSYSTQNTKFAESWLLVGLRFAHSHELLTFGEQQACQPVDSTGWLLNMMIINGRSLIANWEMSRALRHRVSDLPGRIEFETCIRQLAKGLKLKSQPMSLLFINPDNFDQINHRFGREQGDTAVRDVATLLRSILRESDLLFHYTGAIFAIVLPGTDPLGSKAIAEKIQEKILEAKFVNDVVKLTISIGCSCSEPLDKQLLDAGELIQRADSALNIAKLAGGARVVFWSAGRRVQSAGALNKGSAIFTADPVKDYRNMGLLWELMSSVSAERETAVIGRELTGRVAKAFKSNVVALFGVKAHSSSKISKGRAGTYLVSASEWQPETTAVSPIDVSADESRIAPLIESVLAERRPSIVKLSSHVSRCVVPLVVREDLIGCLYIDNESNHEMDERDLEFLSALVSQIAVSLDRADLLDKWLQKRDEESKKLRVEVSELRQAVRENKLVYQSAEMQQIMLKVQKVAQTDATVLITGESGTGKEMLGHAVHDLSHRFDKPFVTVDCGAISPNLIEAELFGRVKGAYTGADTASKGYIRQAEGGTLFLDEIGELPIDVQTRLLRFVQEKTVNSVGASISQKIDVRIIAATNRDLIEEVKVGGFRSDLFYRLQVMTLTPPPLRDHPSDILPIAYHFLEKYCLQYQKRGLYLSADAKAILESYSWPGNVRELQHSVLRAVLMVDGVQIGVRELDLQKAVKPSDGEDNRDWPGSMVESESSVALGEDLWTLLEKNLVTLVDTERENLSPLGRWLTEEFLLIASQQAFGVIRNAADLLGQAESTYRRQLTKAQRLRQLEQGPKCKEWQQVEKIVYLLVRARNQPDVTDKNENIIRKARETLLGVVERATGKYLSRGAALMDVSTPTYKSWLGVQ